MIKDRRDEYQRIIEDVAQRKGIAEVRIFINRANYRLVGQGQVGTVVDKKAEACYGCHRETRLRSCFPPIARPVSIIQQREVFWD